MSGRALAGQCEFGPIPNRPTLESVQTAVLSMMRRKWKNISHYIVPTVSLRQYDTVYGDADFIISQDFIEEESITPKQIATILGSVAFAQNGQVWTFEFRKYLVDLILVPKVENIRTCSILYGHKGVGHLLRSIIKPYGYRLRDTGLCEKVEADGQVLKELVITMDWESVCGYHRISSSSGHYGWSYGVDTLRNAFHLLVINPLFTLGAFDLDENLNYHGKPERMSLPAFPLFIEYLKERQTELGRAGLNLLPVNPTDAQRKLVSRAMDPNEQHRNAKQVLIEEHRHNKVFRRKFSGDFVKNVVGMEEGPSLGIFMNDFRSKFSTPYEFEFFIMSSSEDTLAERLIEFKQTWIDKTNLPELVVSKRPKVARKKVVLAPPKSDQVSGEEPWYEK